MRLALIERRIRTLVGRVAFVALFAAVGGGFLAAIAAVTLAEVKVERAEDRRLREEAFEILHEASPLTGDGLEEHVETERRELERMGLRLAVRHGGTTFGDSTLPLLSDGCATLQTPRKLRVCALEKGPVTCVVATEDVPGLGGGFIVGVVFGAAIVAALIGAWASRWLAGWATGPLARLGTKLGDAPMDEATDLGPDEGVVEIDALRRILRALLDRRAEALRAARLFAAGAAHELRTPLTTLSGELELLAEEPLAEQVRGEVGRLRGSTARIVDLVERLLVLARLGAAEAMRQDAVELGDLVEEVCRRALRGTEGRLTYEVREAAMVRGDESLLAVLCENAVNNALLHAAPAAVRIVIDACDENVIFDVIDEGPGIEPNERVRLFEPFQRGATLQKGVGLGLALVGQIARAHGGEAMFVDAVRGAHLRIRLPRWTPRPARA